jgi:hypothetical protein
MAGKERGTELPHRIPGAAWTEPLSPVAPAAPVPSPELRQRMQAAVKAERAEAAAREQKRAAGDRTTEPSQQVPPSTSAAGRETGPVARPLAGATNGKRTGAAAEPAPRPEPTARPRPGRPRSRAGARLAALGLALIVIGSLAAAAAKHFSRPPTAQAAVRALAAAWVAGQVSPQATVSCDAVMCAALKAHGFPAGKLVMLGPTSPDPVPSVLVVETATVRALFGSSLAIGGAPAVLASFGSGPGVITVRVVAPHGAAAYQAALNADLADRKRSGTALLNDSRITVSANARSQLAAGQADSRLLAALTLLAGHQPVDIVRFENLGPGASPGVPLRFADLAESVPAAHLSTAAYMRAAWALLSGADPRIRPAKAVSGTLQGQAVLQIQFSAPSPLGTIGRRRTLPMSERILCGAAWHRRTPVLLGDARRASVLVCLPAGLDAPGEWLG